jgi:hypothetical protein
MAGDDGFPQLAERARAAAGAHVVHAMVERREDRQLCDRLRHVVDRHEIDARVGIHRDLTDLTHNRHGPRRMLRAIARSRTPREHDARPHDDDVEVAVGDDGLCFAFGSGYVLA